MRLSVITPTNRIYNLPIVLKSLLNMHTEDARNIEWIIVFEGAIDEKILAYEHEGIDIILKPYTRQEGDPYAAFMRNIALEFVTGDYIYYLDDDTLIHRDLYNLLKYEGSETSIMIFNQFSETMKRREFNFDVNKIKPMQVDTAQFAIPVAYKDIKWINDGAYNDEFPYLQLILNKYGRENVIWNNQGYSYRNYLRRYEPQDNYKFAV